MLKRNLIVIAIASISLLFVSNALGQAADWEIKPAVKKPKNTIKKPRQVQPGNSSGTISNQRNSGNLSKTRKPKVKQMFENNTTYQQRRRQPNPRAKRQYKPI